MSSKKVDVRWAKDVSAIYIVYEGRPLLAHLIGRPQILVTSLVNIFIEDVLDYANSLPVDKRREKILVSDKLFENLYEAFIFLPLITSEVKR